MDGDWGRRRRVPIPARSALKPTFDFAIENDKPRLDSLVDAMADLIGRTLNLRLDLGLQSITFGAALTQEKNYFPTRSVLDHLDALEAHHEFVGQVEAMVHDIRRSCLHARQNTEDETVVLTPHVYREGWIEERIYKHIRGETPLPHAVGGVGELILGKVEDEVLEWLVLCDAALCAACGDFGDDANARAHRVTLDEGLEHLIFTTTIELSHRIVGSEPREPPLPPPEGLEESLALSVLRTFECLARCGVGAVDARGRRLLDVPQALHLLVVATSHPPSSMYMTGKNAQLMGMPRLAAALKPDLAPQVRVNLVRSWHAVHGVYAAVASKQGIVIAERPRRQANGETEFVDVLYINKTEELHEGAIRMPRFSWLGHQYAYYLRNTKDVGRERGYSWHERRAIRLASLVYQLFSVGELEHGVVGAHLIEELVFKHMNHARWMSKMLRTQVEFVGRGMKILSFVEHVLDVESSLGDSIKSLSCVLSRFSTSEIVSAFHYDSRLTPRTLPYLNFKTREMVDGLGGCVPPRYRSFVADVLPIIVQSVANHRESQGVTPVKPPNPLVELLRSCPRLRSWHPLQGTLWLELKDVQQGGAALEATLRSFATEKRLVALKRPTVGGKRAAKPMFVFDTPSLVKLLRQQP